MVTTSLVQSGSWTRTPWYSTRSPLQEALAGSDVPDLHVPMEEVLVDGHRISTRATVTGIQTGDLMGIPAAARGIALLAVELPHICDLPCLCGPCSEPR
jgi:hypothetical protein